MYRKETFGLLLGCKCRLGKCRLGKLSTVSDPHGSSWYINQEGNLCSTIKIILAFLAPQVVTSDPAPYESSLRQAVHQSQKCRQILQNRQPFLLETIPVAPNSPSFYEMRPNMMQSSNLQPSKSFTSFYIRTTKLNLGIRYVLHKKSAVDH